MSGGRRIRAAAAALLEAASAAAAVAPLDPGEGAKPQTYSNTRGHTRETPVSGKLFLIIVLNHLT